MFNQDNWEAIAQRWEKLKEIIFKSDVYQKYTSGIVFFEYDIPYLLQRVGELEKENTKLRHIIEAAGISMNDAITIEKHLSKMEEGAKWTK